MSREKRGNKDKFDGLSGGIFMVGFGILFLVDSISFWPWILVVIGLSSLPASVAHEGLWAGAQGFIWMTGLAVLFETGLFWPGILILIGLSILAGSLARPPMLETQKPKRGLLLEDDGQDW